MSEASGPLAGLRVLDASRLYPGAFASSLLADLGADVIKLEAPGFGDGLRHITPESFKAGHVALNRGKRSVSLDLRAAGGPALFTRLVRSADVVIESHRPGALAKSGISYDDLSVDQPELIWCSLTGFGSTGPMATAAGHDITFSGYAALLGLLTGSEDPPPVPQVTSSVQLGALVGVVGILAAHAQRIRTGRGAHVDTSLAEATMWTIAEDIARAAVAPAPGWPPMASRQVYRCADDRWITVAASEPKSWAALCSALDLGELADHQIGVDEPAAMSRLADVFAAQPAAHWLQSPGLAGGVGPVNEPGDLVADPHVMARNGIVALDDGSARVVASPVRLRGPDGDARTATSPPPDLGQHTDEVLAEIGLGATEIESLRNTGVIGSR